MGSVIYNHPIGKDYKWYISGIYCQLGDYISPIPPIEGTRNNHCFFLLGDLINAHTIHGTGTFTMKINQM